MSSNLTASARLVQVPDFPYLTVSKAFFGDRCDKDEENVPKYLERRNDGRSANYYVRKVAPTDIQMHLKKEERVYRQSTGTADLRRAKVVAAELVSRKMREWQSIREAMSPDAPACCLLTRSFSRLLARGFMLG